jgi:nicotinamidase-related amidase
MNKVLIVIDAQEDFTRGALRNKEAIQALPIIHNLVEYASKNDMKIIYTQDTHQEDYFSTQEGRKLPVPHCIYQTVAWTICPEVEVDTAKVIRKQTFGYPHWDVALNSSTDEIWLCGFCTDICVSANFQILKANFPEIPIVVIEDACAGVTPELHEAAIKVMKSCQAKILKFNELNI